MNLTGRRRRIKSEVRPAWWGRTERKSRVRPSIRQRGCGTRQLTVHFRLQRRGGWRRIFACYELGAFIIQPRRAEGWGVSKGDRHLRRRPSVARRRAERQRDWNHVRWAVVERNTPTKNPKTRRFEERRSGSVAIGARVSKQKRTARGNIIAPFGIVLRVRNEHHCHRSAVNESYGSPKKKLGTRSPGLVVSHRTEEVECFRRSGNEDAPNGRVECLHHRPGNEDEVRNNLPTDHFRLQRRWMDGG